MKYLYPDGLVGIELSVRAPQQIPIFNLYLCLCLSLLDSFIII